MQQTNLLSTLSFLAILVFFGCEKDAVVEQLPAANPEISLQVSTVNDKGEVLKTETITKHKNETTLAAQSRSNPNQIATGDFQVTSGNLYDISAIMNNGGIHGEVEINHGTYGLIQSETLCVSTNGDEAIIAARYTSIEFPSYPVLENNIWFWKLKDNGEGGNSDPDQTSSLILVYTNWFDIWETPQDFLEDFPCAGFYDDPDFQILVDIAEGQIQVH